MPAKVYGDFLELNHRVHPGLNENGTTVSYDATPSDYLVDVIASKATTFIENTSVNFPNKPFFRGCAPHGRGAVTLAAHGLQGRLA